MHGAFGFVADRGETAAGAGHAVGPVAALELRHDRGERLTVVNVGRVREVLIAGGAQIAERGYGGHAGFPSSSLARLRMVPGLLRHQGLGPLVPHLRSATGPLRG